MSFYDDFHRYFMDVANHLGAGWRVNQNAQSNADRVFLFHPEYRYFRISARQETRGANSGRLVMLGYLERKTGAQQRAYSCTLAPSRAAKSAAADIRKKLLATLDEDHKALCDGVKAQQDEAQQKDLVRAAIGRLVDVSSYTGSGEFLRYSASGIDAKVDSYRRDRISLSLSGLNTDELVKITAFVAGLR